MPGRGGYESGPGGGNGSFLDWVFDREPRVTLCGDHLKIRGVMRERDVDELVMLALAAHEKRMRAMG